MSVETFQRYTKYKWHFSFLKKIFISIFWKSVLIFFQISKFFEKILSQICRKRYLNAKKLMLFCEKKSINFDMPKKSTHQKKILPEKKVWNSKKLFFTISWNIKKTCKKIKLGDPNLDIQKFNNFPSFWSF